MTRFLFFGSWVISVSPFLGRAFGATGGPIWVGDKASIADLIFTRVCVCVCVADLVGPSGLLAFPLFCSGAWSFFCFGRFGRSFFVEGQKETR